MTVGEALGCAQGHLDMCMGCASAGHSIIGGCLLSLCPFNQSMASSPLGLSPC